MESVLRYLDWLSVGLTILGGLLILLLLEVFRLNSFRSRSPPGPKPLPFIGNMLQIMKDPLGFVKSMPKYGEISSMYMGRNIVIVLNSLSVLKEAFIQNSAVYAGRSPVAVLDWDINVNGIIMAPYGLSWKQQRRFALHTLRNFGLGKKNVEERIANETQYLIREIVMQEGKPFCPSHLIMNAVSNVICSIIFGDRFEYDDKRFAKLLKILNENIQLSGAPMSRLLYMAPFIKYFLGPYLKVRHNGNSLKDFVREVVKEHRETLDPYNPRDFIDSYLVEMTKQQSNEDSSFHFHEENLLSTTADLFVAGTDTSAATLKWGLIYMMDHPEVQERCHEEIIRVLGFEHTACMDNRAQLPYTNATIHEIQRCSHLVPFALHVTTQPTQLGEYHIPKGTRILPNLTAISADRKHWKHSDTFNPENFLDDKGQFCKNDHFVPFSLGPRVCVGETLAKAELFICFTSMMQRLKFSWPPGAMRPNMAGTVGLVRSPFPFNIVCHSRETTL